MRGMAILAQERKSGAGPSVWRGAGQERACQPWHRRERRTDSGGGRSGGGLGKAHEGPIQAREAVPDLPWRLDPRGQVTGPSRQEYRGQRQALGELLPRAPAPEPPPCGTRTSEHLGTQDKHEGEDGPRAWGREARNASRVPPGGKAGEQGRRQRPGVTHGGRDGGTVTVRAQNFPLGHRAGTRSPFLQVKSQPAEGGPEGRALTRVRD